MFFVTALKKYEWYEEGEYDRAYLSIDRYAGSMSSDLPTWDSIFNHAIAFKSLEEAKEEYEKSKRWLRSGFKDVRIIEFDLDKALDEAAVAGNIIE